MNDVTIHEVHEKAIEANIKAGMALEKINEHTRECSERYAGIHAKLNLLVSRQWNFMVGLVTILLTVLGTVTTKALGWW